MTLETLKQGDSTPTDDVDHLINFLAILVRATKDQYGLTAEQKQVLYNRFERIYDTHPTELLERVLEASDRKDPFWQPSSDTVLKYLHEAGRLVDTLAV